MRREIAHKSSFVIFRNPRQDSTPLQTLTLTIAQDGIRVTFGEPIVATGPGEADVRGKWQRATPRRITDIDRPI
jgi:hypothetical protein